jgi:hypothetical protein
MKPVRTITSNLVYVGPPGVGDLHCQRVEPGLIRSVWHPSALQRKAIADGANIALWVYTEPIPPVAVTVTDEQGIGEDAPEVAARLEELGRAMTVSEATA